MRHRIIQSIFFFLFISTSFSFAQNDQSIRKENAPNLFIDCGYCDINFVKEQIPIVNYVRDRKDADIHVLYTSQSTGSGGTSYILLFIGLNKFAGIDDTVKYMVNKTDSDDQSRIKMVKALKMGLVRYLSKTPAADQMEISFPKQQQAAEQPKDDWDYWVFKLSSNGNFNGEKNYNSKSIYSSISANRTTEDMKLSISLSSDYSESNYYYDTETITNITRSQYANASFIKAIDNKWSWGIWGSAYTSTYDNINFSYSFAPGIEYNVFPYSESNIHQLRIYYKVYHTFNRYVDETLYFKRKEDLWRHSLNASFSLIEPWGSLSFGPNVENYLDDFTNISYGVFSSASLRLFKGFSLSFYFNYYKVGKQITLPLEGASLEEVLLRRRQLETTYNYYAYFGISYSFGSIFNNFINPRFGGGGGSTIIISD
ncbi:MAG: hypothetical protein NTX65_10095 [Ignavibacteriales bacterium]|nr:hypothetical protein [Ignavibacteriales bacterium]